MGKAQLTRLLQIAAVIVIALLAVGLYRAKSDAAHTEARVRQLQSQIEANEADLRALRAEIAHLESPARIERMAEDQLGMRPGSAGAALPERAIDTALPSPRPSETKQ